MKKLKKLSFGYYKFILAGKQKPAVSDSHHIMERKNVFYTFSMDFYWKLKKEILQS